MKRGDIVEVKWVDSAWSGGWRAEGELPRATDCLSVGYLRKDGRKRVTLAQGRSLTTDEYCNHISIPRPAVQSMKLVRKS